MALRVTWDHIHLRSDDPDSAAEFYEAHFDAQRRGRAENGDQLRVTVEVAGNLLFIDRAAPGAAETQEPPVKGIDHLALGVESLDDALAYFAKNKVEIISGPTQVRPGLKIAFIRAPDGVRVELLERGEPN